MKPQTQRWTSKDNPDGRLGDCWRTCIASILEVDRDEVPHFVEFGGPEGAPGTDEGAWWVATNEWLGERGYQIIEWPLEEAPWAPPVITILTGRSPRGEWRHSVVGRGLEIVHDPHPSRDGLVGDPEAVAVFVAVDPALALRGYDATVGTPAIGPLQDLASQS